VTAAPAPRSTRQRTAITELLDEVDDFRSAQELHELLRQRGASVGLATVYRTLQGLADVGDVDAVRASDGGTAYRRCSPRHHHHLVCRFCGRTVEVEDSSVEAWAERIGRDHGFSDVAHTLEIVGTCADCRSRR
jgi:Fur family transcriptional regulator, ferric uptake regulator